MKPALRIALMGIFLGIMVFSGVQIIKTLGEQRKSESLNAELVSQAVATIPPAAQQEEQEGKKPEQTLPITVDFDTLLQENGDIIAWLYSPDTPINYPVVQGKDNDYYLRRLLDGTRNTAGTLFADYRNSPDFSDFYTVIYGHDMRNKTMFGTLEAYKSQEYYEAHKVLYLLTPEKNYALELVSGYIIPANDAIYYLESTFEARERLLAAAEAKSLFQSGVSVADTEKLVVLSTCSNNFDDARLVLLGVLREIP